MDSVNYISCQTTSPQKKSCQSKKEGGLRTKQISTNPINPQHLISVITVVYNGGKYLEKTIKSVINQPYSNLEYIIIDGSSTDETLDIIQKYDECISYWLSEPDSGIYDAMNKGWLNAKDNSYILFLGAGDEIINLPKIAELLEPNTIIYGKVYSENNIYFKSQVNWRLKIGNTIHHQALMIHKSLSEHPPFDDKYKVYGDYDFNARLWLKSVQFRLSDSFISYALPDGISSKTHIVELLKIIQANFGFFWLLTAIVYYVYQGFRYGFSKFTFK